MSLVNFWDALERKRDMPIVPATPEVFFQDLEGRVWDQSTPLPALQSHGVRMGYPPSHFHPLARSTAPSAGLSARATHSAPAIGAAGTARLGGAWRMYWYSVFGIRIVSSPGLSGLGRSHEQIWSSLTGRVASHRGTSVVFWIWPAAAQCGVV